MIICIHTTKLQCGPLLTYDDDIRIEIYRNMRLIKVTDLCLHSHHQDMMINMSRKDFSYTQK